jgi:hypothetical protein
MYDLGIFATKPHNQALVRRLTVLKLWQARDSFDPERLLLKFSDSKSYDWVTSLNWSAAAKPSIRLRSLPTASWDIGFWRS